MIPFLPPLFPLEKLLISSTGRGNEEEIDDEFVKCPET